MRKDDHKTNVKHFRSNRFYHLKGKWFFQTRENESVGPFEDMFEAGIALKAYIAYKTRQDKQDTQEPRRAS